MGHNRRDDGVGRDCRAVGQALIPDGEDLSAYRKLGISSRAQLARALDRGDAQPIS